MNDNYLWDRTGEPDPEIQQVEELLGTLRYQPRPLEIPANIRVSSKRPFYLPVTIAAAIIVAVILFGLWFQFRRTPAMPKQEVKRDNPVPPPPNSQSPGPEEKPEVVRERTPDETPRRQMNRNVLAVYRRPARKPETIEPRLTPQEQADKEQVLLALKIVSAKLNLAQRKTTSTPSPNIIRNHKIG